MVKRVIEEEAGRSIVEDVVGCKVVAIMMISNVEVRGSVRHEGVVRGIGVRHGG